MILFSSRHLSTRTSSFYKRGVKLMSQNRGTLGILLPEEADLVGLSSIPAAATLADTF